MNAYPQPESEYNPTRPVLVMGQGPKDTYPLHDYFRLEAIDPSLHQSDVAEQSGTNLVEDTLHQRFHYLAKRLALTAVNLGDYGNVSKRIYELQNVDPHLAFELTLATEVELDKLPESKAKELGGTILAGVMGNLIRESVIPENDGTLQPIFSEQELLRLSDSLPEERVARIARILERSGHNYLALAPFYNLKGPIDPQSPNHNGSGNLSGEVGEAASNKEQVVIDLSVVEAIEKGLMQASATPEEAANAYQALVDIPERDIAFNQVILQKIISAPVDGIEVAFAWFNARLPNQETTTLAEAYDNKLLSMAKLYFGNYPRRPDVMTLFISECSPQLDTTKKQLWELVREAAKILKETTGKDPKMPDGSLIVIPPKEEFESSVTTTAPKQNVNSPSLRPVLEEVEAEPNLPEISDSQLDGIRQMLFQEKIVKIIPSPEEIKAMAGGLPSNPEVVHIYNQLIIDRMLTDSWERVVEWFNIRAVDDQTEPLFKNIYDSRLRKIVLSAENDGNSWDQQIGFLREFRAHNPKLDEELQNKLHALEIRYQQKHGSAWQPADKDGQLYLF